MNRLEKFLELTPRGQVLCLFRKSQFIQDILAHDNVITGIVSSVCRKRVNRSVNGSRREIFAQQFLGIRRIIIQILRNVHQLILCRKGGEAGGRHCRIHDQVYLITSSGQHQRHLLHICRNIKNVIVYMDADLRLRDLVDLIHDLIQPVFTKKSQTVHLDIYNISIGNLLCRCRS